MRMEQQPLKSRMSGVGEKSTSPLPAFTDFRQSPPYRYQISGSQINGLDPPPAVSITVRGSADPTASYLGL